MKRLLVISTLMCLLLGVRLVNSDIQIRAIHTAGPVALLQTLGYCGVVPAMPTTLPVLGPASTYLAGAELAATGDEGEALVQFEQNFKAEGRSLSAILAGVVQWRAGRVKEAARWWAAGLAADGFAAQGKLCGLAGNPQAERANYEAALAAAGLQAVHSETFRGLFQYFGRAGTSEQLQLLVAILKTAQPEWESDVQSLYWLGRAYQAQGQLADALTYFDQALRLEPDHLELLYLAGLAAYNQRDWDRATGYLARIQALTPNYEHTNRLLGEIARRTGRLDEAYQWFERQGDAMGLYGMAQVRFEQQRSNEARQLLERALNSEPRSNEIRLLFARVCRAQQDTACAVEHYRAILQIDPTHADARQGLQELGQPAP